MTPASLPLFPSADIPPVEIRPRAAEYRHLQAARQLSRRMARLPDQSPAQLRAGHQICRHLIAMLEQIEAANDSPPH